MAVKIRLARKGRKKQAFYHIIVADSRAPRDGRFIEKLGIYNPNTDPATIEFNFDKALYWLQKGAQPTDTTGPGSSSSSGVPSYNRLISAWRHPRYIPCWPTSWG